MEVHLPCPPLRDWLSVLLTDQRAAVWAPRRVPRRLRHILADYPALALDDHDRPSLSELASLDALLFCLVLERPDPPEQCLELLRPGTRVIELGVPRRKPVRRLLGIDRRPREQAQRGQSRVLQWLARGYYELEQWESVEPDEVLVTLARAR